jgi:hypothetical protein
MFTKVFGPQSVDRSDIDLLSFLVLLAYNQILEFGTRSSSVFVYPDSFSVTAAGAASYTPIHILGGGIVFGLAVYGSVVFLKNRTLNRQKIVLVLLSSSAVIYAIVFGGPLVGFGLVYPLRWFPFIYIFISILGAIGIIYLLITVPLIKSHQLISLTIFAIIIVALMSGTYIAAIDNPTFSDANAAERWEITDQENHQLIHVSKYAGESEIIGDKISAIIVQRWYKQETTTLQYIFEDRIVTNRDSILLIDRPYLSTNHVNYILTVNDSTLPVTGELPSNVYDCAQNVVYDSGPTNTHRHQIKHTVGGCTVD